jgi:hypothetical protein
MSQPTAAAQGLTALMEGIPRYGTGDIKLNAWGKPITADPLAGVKFERNMTAEERAAELAAAAQAGAAPAFNWAAHHAAQAAKKKGGVRRKRHTRKRHTRKRHTRRRR